MSFRSSSPSSCAALREAFTGASALRVAGTGVRVVAGSPRAGAAVAPARASRRPSAAATPASPAGWSGE